MSHLKTVVCASAIAVAVMGATGVGSQQRAPGGPVLAAATIELTDPAGDVQPIVYRHSVGAGPETEVKYPAFDVTKLTVSSDGKAVTFAATLTAPPRHASYEVVEFHVDADNNPKTGITFPDPKTRLAGLEYYGTLESCLEHPSFGTMCSGADTQATGHSAVVMLAQYGKEWMFTTDLIGFPAAGSVKEAKKVPVKGPLVQASIDYAAMNLKPGQTIRLVMREACAAKDQGFFPDVALTLK